MSFAGLAVAFLLLLPASPQNANDAEGFQHFYNLEFDEAMEAFSREIAESPDAPSGYNHLAAAVIFRAMLQGGALESELVSSSNPFLSRPKLSMPAEDHKRFNDAIQKSIDLSQARLNRNPRNTQALYTAGVAYGLRANYHFIVRKAWRDTLHDANTVHRYHIKATEVDASFIDARLTQGAHDYILGSLPWTWRLIGVLVGFHGNKEAGIRTLQLVAQKGNLARMDAKVFLAIVYRREKKLQLAVPLLEELIGRFPRNYLLYFELAQMYSELGDKTKALAALQKLRMLKESGAPGYTRVVAGKICYSEGNIQFWYDDLDRALENMKRATARAQDLDLDTRVLAWERLGQIYDLKGQRALAQEAYRRAIDTAPASEAARESQRYLASPYRKQKG